MTVEPGYWMSLDVNTDEDRDRPWKMFTSARVYGLEVKLESPGEMWPGDWPLMTVRGRLSAIKGFLGHWDHDLELQALEEGPEDFRL